jgi:hypothetical protein
VLRDKECSGTKGAQGLGVLRDKECSGTKSVSTIILSAFGVAGLRVRSELSVFFGPSSFSVGYQGLTYQRTVGHPLPKICCH